MKEPLWLHILSGDGKFLSCAIVFPRSQLITPQETGVCDKVSHHSLS